MHFEVEQHFGAEVGAVADAYADPALYLLLAQLPKLGQPAVLEHRAEGGLVHLAVRYRFAGELSAPARAVLDPARLTWVEHSVHDLARRAVTYELVPDHYRDRLRSSGSYHFDAHDGGTVRRAQGEVQVKARLVAGAVERAIVSGLQEHLAGEVAIVERFVAGER